MKKFLALVLAPDTTTDMEKIFIDELNANGIDKGFVYAYYMKLENEVQSEGVCYAEDTHSTELEFYPKDFEETWSKDGRSFARFCTDIDALGSVDAELIDDVKTTGTTDITLQGVLKSSPDFYSAAVLGSTTVTYYFGYKLKNNIDTSKFIGFEESDMCDAGQLGYCLAKAYPDGVWQLSDDSNYTYEYVSDSFYERWGDNFYVSVFADGGYFTNIAFTDMQNIDMIGFSSIMSNGRYDWE